MNPLHLLAQAVALAVGVVATGWQYWQLPYEALGRSVNVAVAPGLLAVGMIAAALVVAGAASVRRAWLVMAACLPVTAMIRVMMDTAVDPTHHNLWPFELVLAGGAGGAVAGAGVVLGALLRRVVD